MKVIKMNTPDGQYTLPLQKVAEHRANEYYDGKLKSLLWKEEVSFYNSQNKLATIKNTNDNNLKSPYSFQVGSYDKYYKRLNIE